MRKESLTRKPEKKRWAFLAYIAGDNDLSDAGLEDIQELCDEGASDKVYVGVEIDTYGEHSGSIRYEITKPDWVGAAHRTVIERLHEKDTGDPETLRSFLKWGFRRYPAKNYVVVVWNHGAGFRSVRRDIGYDDFGSSLDMPEIENAFRRSGIGPKNKIAVLGFDACLMNMLEIANHFSDQVEILVGSQQTEPGDGWPYDKVLREVKKSAKTTELAKQIVKVYIEDYKNRGVFNITQSAIDIGKTDAATRALGKLGDLLAENVESYRPRIKKIRLLLQTFEMADYVDLIHLAEVIYEHIGHKAVKEAARAVIRTTSSCILASRVFGSAVENSNGLSVWFPASEDIYYNYRGKYLALKCNRNGSGWVRFLDTYHST